MSTPTNPTKPTQPTHDDLMSQPTHDDLAKLVLAQAAEMERLKQQLADSKSAATKSDSTPFTPYIIPGSMMLPDKANSLSSIRVMTEAIRKEVESLTDVESAKPEVRRSFRLMISLLNRTQLSNHTPTSKTKPDVKADEIKSMNLLVSVMKSKGLITDEVTKPATK